MITCSIFKEEWILAWRNFKKYTKVLFKSSPTLYFKAVKKRKPLLVEATQIIGDTFLPGKALSLKAGEELKAISDLMNKAVLKSKTPVG